MKIAIIGTGNVGGALATQWSNVGHQIFLGVLNKENFKGKHLLDNPSTSVEFVQDAVIKSEVILLATPAIATIDVAQSLGNTEGKVIIDAMNIINNQGPKGFNNTTDAVLVNTHTNDVVKCFNTTGFNNMVNPIYDQMVIDNFVAGDSKKAKEVAIQLSKDIGFENCYDIGGNDKFHLMEQYAFFWINLAIFQGYGREVGFKLLKR